MHTNLGLDVLLSTIRYYAGREPWKTIIVKFRQKYIEGISEVPISNKRWRMERLHELYQQVKGKPGLDIMTKNKIQMLVTILERAQTEVDPSKKGQLIDQFNQQVNVVFSAPDGQRLGMDGLRPAPGTT